MKRYRWLKLALVLTVFLVALLPRVIYPVSRPYKWYVRSVKFIESVVRGDWAQTAYSEHPGVTVMWLSGAALRLAGVVPVQEPDGDLSVDSATLTVRESTIGILPLALVIAALVALTYLLLLRLFARPAAFAASLLVGLDPFFIANSKVLHVDGLLTALMATSGVAMLVYLSERRWRWAILSGVLAGLALLTKAPALFLVPYALLCLGVGLLAQRGKDWRRDVLAGLLWVLALAVVYFALFPAMWVDPLTTLKDVYGSAALRIGWTHVRPLFFQGQAITYDPGPVYYLYTWGYKATAVVAVFALVALLYAVAGKGTPGAQRLTVGMLFAFAFFFTVQMMLGAKKMPRYLVPAFPSVDILAGVGLVWWAGRWRARQLLTASVLVLQAALVLPHHPYYDTYFSGLGGGHRAGMRALSGQWQGEGLDIAARMLSGLPDAPHQVVGSHMASMFAQYFVGQTVDVDQPADWYVLGVSYMMRGAGWGDGEIWGMDVADAYSRRQPSAVVTLDGLPYVWVHRAADGPQNSLDCTFEAGIQLVGYDLASPTYEPGQVLGLQLYWQATEPPAEDYLVSLQLVDGTGTSVAGGESALLQGPEPSSGWEPGVVETSPYDLLVPPDVAPGDYTLSVALQRGSEDSVLAVRCGEGSQDRQVLLATVSVELEPPPVAVWAAWAGAFMVGLSAVAGLIRS